MSIEISRPWARFPDPGARYAGGFMTLVNNGAEPDRLVEASSPLAQEVQICGIKVVGPGIRMRRLEGGLRLPPGVTITLKPRGYHLLLRRLNTRLEHGQHVPVTLRFDRGGTHEVGLIVEADGPVGLFALSRPGIDDARRRHPRQ